MNEWQSDNRPSENNPNDAVDYRQQIITIEKLLAEEDPRYFTAITLNNLIEQVNSAIRCARNNLDKTVYNKKELHKQLFDAQKYLLVAIGERKKKEITVLFCDYLRKAREHLEEALQLWQN